MSTQGQNIPESISMSIFLSELEKKVSMNNARLLLHSAAIRTGMAPKFDQELQKDQAEALCMELIRSGGPGFQAGRTIYNQIIS